MSDLERRLISLEMAMDSVKTWLNGLNSRLSDLEERVTDEVDGLLKAVQSKRLDIRGLDSRLTDLEEAVAEG